MRQTSHLITLYSFFLLLLCQMVSAQTSERIRSPRPGNTFGPFTTGRNVFQVQTGIQVSDTENEQTLQSTNGLNHLVSLRFGVSEKFEIRSAFRLNRDRQMTATDDQLRTGLSAWIVGVRWNMLNNPGKFTPSLALQADANLNTLSEDFAIDDPAPRILLLHAQNLTSKLVLMTNWGVSWNGNTGIPSTILTGRLVHPVGDNVFVMIENFGSITDGDWDAKWDAGVGYFLSNDLMIDFSAGFGNNEDVQEKFVDFGLSWRINSRTSSK